MTYFHSHLRVKALTSSVQSSLVQWNFPSACLNASRGGLGISFMRDEGGDPASGDVSLLSGVGSDMGGAGSVI